MTELLNKIMAGEITDADEAEIDKYLIKYWDSIDDETLEYKAKSLVLNYCQELEEWLG